MGGRTTAYYTDVKAKDEYDAMEIAEGLSSDKWFEIETDNVIEPYEVVGKAE
jgi:hypothetical protein